MPDSRLTASHARALLVLPLAADQEAVAALAIAEGLNVRDTERAVQDRLTRAASAPRPRAPSAPEERRSPTIVALRRGLELALGVPVRLQRRKGGGGRIVIDWAEDADLDALYRKLGGPAALRRSKRAAQPTGRSAAPVSRASAASASKLARNASMYFGRSAGL